MSNCMQGMDTEYARQVSTQMGQHASQVAGVCSRLFARVQATSWVGPDKTGIQSDLVQHFMPAAQAASDSIDEQARVLTAHADRQDRCSA